MYSVRTLVILTLFSTILACSDQQDCCVQLPGAYSTGVFVVNEGPFGGTGTISWYNPETGEVQDSIYEKANNGAVLGQFVQSLYFHNNYAYIVVNGANRVVVADAATFKYRGVINGFELPRYFLPIDDRTAYISQWGADGLTGSIAKVDLETFSILKTIPTGKGPEKMVLANDRVYVANSGGYGKDSSITEILLADDSAQTTPIAAGLNPACLAWLPTSSVAPIVYLCKGYFLDTEPKGAIGFFPGNAASKETPAFADDLCLDATTNQLYFIGGGNVYRSSLTSGLDLSVLFAQSAYGLGFDAFDQLLYCADAKDFASAGEVVVFKTDGTKMTSFRTGVAPGEVVIVK